MNNNVFSYMEANMISSTELFKMVCEADENNVTVGIPAVMLPQDAGASLQEDLQNKLDGICNNSVCFYMSLLLVGD